MTASLAILNQTGKQCFLKCLMNMGTLKRLENIISIFLDKLLSWHCPLLFFKCWIHEHLIRNGMLLPVIV